MIPVKTVAHHPTLNFPVNPVFSTMFVPVPVVNANA
jgi:hypothetical protein